MSAPLSLKHKILMFLRGLGVKGVNATLLQELPRRGKEWAELAVAVLSNRESPGTERSAVLKQMMMKGFLDRHPQKAMMIDVLIELINEGVGDERHQVLRFVSDRLDLFPKDSDAFQGKIMVLQRSTTPEFANAADEILGKIGLDMRDPDLFKTGE